MFLFCFWKIDDRMWMIDGMDWVGMVSGLAFLWLMETCWCNNNSPVGGAERRSMLGKTFDAGEVALAEEWSGWVCFTKGLFGW